MNINIFMEYDIDDSHLKQIMNNYYDGISEYDFFYNRDITIENCISSIYEDEEIIPENKYLINCEIEYSSKETLKQFFNNYFDELYYNWINSADKEENNESEIEELRKENEELKKRVQNLTQILKNTL